MTEEERLREIARRPSPLKSLLDIGSTIGTYGVEKMREMPERAVQDVKSAVVEPAKSAYHAAAQITGQEPYDRDEAIRHALNIANAMTLGAGAYEAPEGALRSGLSRNRERPMMAVHETDLDKLRLSQRQGGLPARSTGIIDPQHPFGTFGDISLLGGREWANPKGGYHRVFQGDPYTPNPLLTERPVEDVVADVRQQPYRLLKESALAPELVRAYLTPEFKSFEEMEGKSNLLTSRRKSQEYKDLSNQFMEDIRERMMPHYRGSDILPESAAHRAMVDPEYRNQYFRNLPADVEEDIAALPEISAKAPQHYFEAKNYGIANIGEPSMAYKGAIVPHHLGPKADPILRDFGIRDIYHTDTSDPERLLRGYEQFKHLQFADGGQVWDKPRPKSLGRPSHLTPKQKAKAKAAAEAAGRPYPNLIDNMRVAHARAEGGPVANDEIKNALRLSDKSQTDLQNKLTGYPYHYGEERKYRHGVQQEYYPNLISTAMDTFRGYGAQKPYAASPQDTLALRYLEQNLEGTTTPQDIERSRADITPKVPATSTPYASSGATPSFAAFDRRDIQPDWWDTDKGPVKSRHPYGSLSMEGSTTQRGMGNIYDVADTLDQGKRHALGVRNILRHIADREGVVAMDQEGIPYPPTRPQKFAAGGRTPAWQRSEGKDPKGGLNAKGRAAYNRQNPGKPGLKPPAPHPKTNKDASRRASFCARMKGMKAKLTSSETANDPNSRINKSLRAWNCRADGGPVMHDDIKDALRLALRRHFDNGGTATSMLGGDSASTNPNQFVSNLYQQDFGRPADQNGQQYWEGQLQAGTMSPDQVAQAFQASPEYYSDPAQQYRATHPMTYPGGAPFGGMNQDGGTGSTPPTAYPAGTTSYGGYPGPNDSPVYLGQSATPQPLGGSWGHRYQGDGDITAPGPMYYNPQPSGRGLATPFSSQNTNSGPSGQQQSPNKPNSAMPFIGKHGGGWG